MNSLCFFLPRNLFNDCPFSTTKLFTVFAGTFLKQFQYCNSEQKGSCNLKIVQSAVSLRTTFKRLKGSIVFDLISNHNGERIRMERPKWTVLVKFFQFQDVGKQVTVFHTYKMWSQTQILEHSTIEIPFSFLFQSFFSLEISLP